MAKITTEEEALAAVRQDGWKLEYVPENLRTAKVCFEAVKQGGMALRRGSPLQYVPEKLKTTELCLEAVKRDGWSLIHVPPGLKTVELCHEAVKQVGYDFGEVPEELRVEVFNKIKRGE